jgi:hypothetical protein
MSSRESLTLKVKNGEALHLGLHAKMLHAISPCNWCAKATILLLILVVGTGHVRVEEIGYHYPEIADEEGHFSR